MMQDYGSIDHQAGNPVHPMPSNMSTVSSTAGLDPENHVHIQFQFGLHRENVIVYKPDLSMTALMELAYSIVENQFSQAQVFSQLNTKLHLFHHDLSAANVLVLLQSVDALGDRSLIEIVLSADFDGNELQQIRPHDLSVHSYKSPTFCDYCAELLWGIVRQGIKCKGCGQNYHKRCAYKIPNNCTLDRKRQRKHSIAPQMSHNQNGQMDDTISIGSSASLLSNSSASRPNSKYIGRPFEKDIKLMSKIKVPHTFQIHSYTRPTVCQQCKKLLRGLVKQGLRCKDCKFNCHKKCMRLVPDDCPGEDENQSRPSDTELDSQEQGSDDSGEGEGMQIDDNICSIEEEPGCGSSGIENREMEITPVAEDTVPNIPLMRVVQSVKHTKKRSSTVLKEGWLVHFTDKDAMRKRHYWRVDTKSIMLYQEETGSKFYKEIPLSEVLTIVPASNLEPGFPPYQLKLVTSGLQLFVRDDTINENVSEVEKNITQWFNVIKQALMPVAASRAEAIVENQNVASLKRKASVMVSFSKETPEDENVKDISQIYQIFPDEILGSGQFGIVYGGKHRKQGFDVAIKVVDKLRFPHKEESQLRHEVQILEFLDQPGIVKLYNMFETPEQVFVVMEKLRGDMLEMILSSENGRLPERITKFLISQILVALRYLHMKNIVHCDLKPENVLLSSNDPFPQVKLCDFGFARIIGEKSFRRSVVGTPAYLAPEVLRKQSYNRSLDMWSVGVIIYVSLSGTFPFNEDEDINQQIQNAAFMYPPMPWREISRDAIELIMDLLQVKSRKRLSVDKASNHSWLQDYQTWLDLRELENNFGRRYLTHESDDERWEMYRREQTEGTSL
ncbi:serine/threonine-protein kinase D1-like [Styela clava]|uniref:serine/threonine-protein kinase D1-like n=1 Tax=Styela clava TaxID=7725 RepID=UPI00193A440E|nr:serine/threonine-protein kinase D1-like [Styela clava]